MNTIWPDK